MNSTEKIAKVIATCFVEREVRKSEAWYEHGQNLGSPESVLEMIKFIVKKEQEIDAGAPMDTIIVNNDSGCIHSLYWHRAPRHRPPSNTPCPRRRRVHP